MNAAQHQQRRPDEQVRREGRARCAAAAPARRPRGGRRSSSANGVLPLAGLLGGRFDLFHHLPWRSCCRRRRPASPGTAPPATGGVKIDARGAGRLELQELGVERVLQPRHLERQRLRRDRAVRRDARGGCCRSTLPRTPVSARIISNARSGFLLLALTVSVMPTELRTGFGPPAISGREREDAEVEVRRQRRADRGPHPLAAPEHRRLARWRRSRWRPAP